MMYEGVVLRRVVKCCDIRVHAPLILNHQNQFVNLNTRQVEVVISVHPMSTARRKLWLEEPK